MTIRAAFAALFRRRSASAFPVRSQPFRLASAARSGPARHIAPMQSGDGLAQLQARRLALLEEAARQKGLRRSKEASICEAELRVVTHQILSNGAKHA